MAHKKGVGSSKNGRESHSKRLGIKLFGGQAATAGNIIVRQRGTKHHPGKNVGIGKDHTLFALVDGTVLFKRGAEDKTFVSVLPLVAAPVVDAPEKAKKAASAGKTADPKAKAKKETVKGEVSVKESKTAEASAPVAEKPKAAAASKSDASKTEASNAAAEAAGKKSATEEAPKAAASKGKAAEVSAEGAAEKPKASKKAAKGDDLKKIEGVGPKIAEVFVSAGIDTFAKLAKSTPEDLKKILDEAGSQFSSHDPGTWPEQASLAAEGKWDELQKMHDELKGGKEE